MYIYDEDRKDPAEEGEPAQKKNKFKSGICGPPSHAPLSFAPSKCLRYPIREGHKAQYQTCRYELSGANFHNYLKYEINTYRSVIDRSEVFPPHREESNGGRMSRNGPSGAKLSQIIGNR